MLSQLFSKLRTLLFLASFYLVGCSKNIDNLPLNEQAIYKDNRFSDDIAKDQYRKPKEVLNFIELKPNMTVVDLLGGGGYYSELFSHIVGKNGRVYLQNNLLFLRFSAKEIDQRLANSRLTNIVRLDSEYDDLKLPKQVDVIFLGLSLHDFFVKRKEPTLTANAEGFYQQITRSLKPDGIVIVIDHSAQEGSGISKTSKLHRIDEQWVRKDFEKHGFEYQESLNLLKNPADDREQDIWKKKVFHNTDRFIHKYKKINQESQI